MVLAKLCSPKNNSIALEQFSDRIGDPSLHDQCVLLLSFWFIYLCNYVNLSRAHLDLNYTKTWKLLKARDNNRVYHMCIKHTIKNYMTYPRHGFLRGNDSGGDSTATTRPSFPCMVYPSILIGDILQ